MVNSVVATAMVVGLLGWAYKAIRPPPPRICGSPGGPPVTSPRVKLSDGRHLAYREAGVPKEEATYKIIVIHGFSSSKDLSLPISQEFIDEFGIYFLHFDRAGYGESDPHPSRSVKSEAYDIQELADILQIGDKFYVIGLSMGAYPVWSCLRYIPHRHEISQLPVFIITTCQNLVASRLSGASLVVPFISYWWPCIPQNLSREAFKKLPQPDRWTFRVARHAPWLLYWWMSQKWFPSLSIMSGSMEIFSPDDLELFKNLPPDPTQEKITQQGEHESLHRDLMVGFGKWEFDVTEISNPFPDKEGGGGVHLWQGYEDRIIPYMMNRYISQKLPWIHYHEVPKGGHFFSMRKSECEVVIRALLLS